MNAMTRTRIVAALAAAIGCAACTSTSTNTAVTAPSADKCQVNVSGATTSFPSTGGTGSVAVSAARDCAWSAATSAGWVSISSSQSGQGSGSVSYSVAPNPATSARSGAISVAGQSVSLSQAGAPCHYAISRSSDAIGAAGGRLSVDVSTIAGCSWTAVSGVGWIAVTGGASGGASGTVSLAVAANNGAARVGQLNVAGQNYTVNQDGAPGAPAPPQPEPSPGPSPSPSTGQDAEFFGIVANVIGTCPNLTFNVSGATVVTDKGTKFKDISCGDVAKGGRIVQGSGTTDASGAIHADVVQKAGN